MVQTVEMASIVWIRNIVVINYTLYLSLPKSWAELYGVTKEDKMKIELGSDGSLRITRESE